MLLVIFTFDSPCEGFRFGLRRVKGDIIKQMKPPKCVYSVYNDEKINSNYLWAAETIVGVAVGFQDFG